LTEAVKSLTVNGDGETPVEGLKARRAGIKKKAKRTAATEEAK
jgi:hypothetical protein